MDNVALFTEKLFLTSKAFVLIWIIYLFINLFCICMDLQEHLFYFVAS